MTPMERKRATVLVVEPDAADRNGIKGCLRTLGYGNVADVPNHATALERLVERPVTHIIFDAKKTNMPPIEFLHKVMELDRNITAIPSSYEPNVDDVFNLLIMGAKGYLVKPFTTESIEKGLVMATKGEPISELVLQAKDRNEALVAIMMASLDKAAMIMRQAQKFETAKRELPRALGALRRSADLAKTFCKDGEEGLVSALERFCIDRSKGPATRLGRLRKRLHTTRSKDDEEGEEVAP